MNPPFFSIYAVLFNSYQDKENGSRGFFKEQVQRAMNFLLSKDSIGIFLDREIVIQSKKGCNKC